MAEKKGIWDKLMEMPKSKLFALLAVVVVVIGLLVYYFDSEFSGKNKQAEETPEVNIIMPDPTTGEYDKTRMESYKDADMAANIDKVTDSYWNSLGENLVSEGSKVSQSDLDPSIYSAVEIYQITHGQKTKEQVDREHEFNAQRRAQLASGFGGGGTIADQGAGAAYRPMTQAQKDSLYFDRMERAYKLAAKYSVDQNGNPLPTSAQANAAAAAQPEPEPEPEPERTIDLSPDAFNDLPSDSFGSDGIVTSLVAQEDDGVVHYAGTVRSKPVKATFLKNETISDGQRVIIRLMQDMVLSNGTTIPANTHITGTCKFGSRLKIDVKMLHYNGRMFPIDISAYDNDGTEGIYCPTVDDGKKKKNVAKQVAGGALSAAGTVVGTVLTGNPFIGRVASSGLQAATSSINSDGSVSVKVTSGYEFYLFENVKLD